MAKASLHLRQRPDADGRHAVLIMISHKGKTIRLSTGQSTTEKAFHRMAGRECSTASFLLQKVQIMLDNLVMSGEIGGLSVEDMREKAYTALGLKQAPQARLLLYDLLLTASERKRAQRTRELYNETARKLAKYGLTLADVRKIDRHWLEDLDRRMEEDGLMTNTRAIHMRNIRAVYNDLLKDELITRYPFRNFSIRREATRHRTMSLEQIRALRDCSPETPQKVMYRDLFMLSFYLVGISPKDLLEAKADQLVDGRLEYRRSKTGRLYSVKVEPEAQEILDRYRGKDWLLSVRDTYQNFRDFCRRWREGLAGIGTGSRQGRRGDGEPVLSPDVTPYWARHSWATIAFNEAGVNKDAVSLALGHSFGVEVTNVYIEFSNRIVDEANRKVLDVLKRQGPSITESPCEP